MKINFLRWLGQTVKIIQIKGIMNKNQLGKGAGEDNPFVKGMTLEQYMAQSTFQKLQKDSLEESIEDNLYQSCKELEKERFYSKKRNYRIDQIDEESVEDSKDYHGHQETIETPDFEHPNKDEPFAEQSQLGKAIKARTNSISMSTAITFKNTQLDQNNNFRFKRLSVSPQKKKLDNIPGPLPGASITLYGSKFGQSPPPVKQNKMPEMLTFYGKLHLEGGEDVLRRKASVKESDLKQKFKKKPQYQLNRVLQFDSQMRGNIGYKTGYPDLKVEGFGERKGKFI